MALAARLTGPSHLLHHAARRQKAQRIRRRHSWRVSAHGSPAEPDPHAVLGVLRSASRADIRAAYYARLQEVHPDVSGADTTLEAVQLNLAYARLIGDSRARSRDSEEEDERRNVFDEPEAEPNCLFVNPFACGISPLQWRELQELVVDAPDPEGVLQAAGLFFAYDAAVCWVSPGQLAELIAELEAMEQTMSVDITSYYVTDCLLRARHANDRVTYVRTRGGVRVDP